MGLARAKRAPVRFLCPPTQIVRVEFGDEPSVTVTGESGMFTVLVRVIIPHLFTSDGNHFDTVPSLVGRGGVLPLLNPVH